MSTRTPAPPPPVLEEEPDHAPTAARFSLSATQIAASALAATTATVCASYLGVAGTVIGAAVASVLTVVGNAVYSHSIQRTGAKVREAVPAAARFAPRPAPTGPPAARPKRARERRGAWRTMAAACVGVFAGVLLVVTAVELVAGRPLTDLVRGDSGSGTSVFGATSKQRATTPVTPTPTTTVTVTPSVVVVTPTVTVTTSPATETETATTSPSSSEPTPPSTPTTSDAPTTGSSTSP